MHSQDKTYISKKPSPRVIWLDYIKSLSLLLVVCIHLVGYGVSLHPVGSLTWMLSNVLDTVSHIAVPLFVMTSGSLMLDPDKDVTWRFIWKKRIARIAITFIFWSTVYALFNFLLNDESIFTLIWRLLAGQNHLWFLFMIAILYALVPMLADVANRPYGGYITLLLLGLSVLNTVPQFISPESAFGPIGDLFSTWVSSIRFNPGYLGLFLLGRRLYVAKRSNNSPWLTLLFIVAAILAIIGTYYLSSSQGSLNEYFYQAGAPTTILMSVSVFLLAKQGARELSRGTIFSRLVTEIARVSLGVYAVHMVFVLIIAPYVRDSFPYMALSVLPVYILSVVSALLLRRVPGLGRYIA